MILNPVLVQDMRMRMRGGTSYLLLTSVILGFGGFTLATFWAITNVVRPVAAVTVPIAGAATAQAQPLDRLLVSQRGAIFFLLMALWAVMLIAFIVPGATSGTIAREREMRTLPLIMSTPLSPLAIIVGKLLASASYVVLMAAAGIPLFTLVIMFGGVPGSQVISTAIVVLVTAFAFAALGVFISSVARNGLVASLITYAVVLILTLGS